MDKGFNELWVTPVYRGTIGNKTLLDDVCESILVNEHLDTPPSDFQKYDILNDGPEILQTFREEVVYPAFKEFLKYFQINLDEYNNIQFRSWLGGCKNGYHIPVHNHSGSQISGVFYLLCDEEEKGGELFLIDPRSNANRGYDNNFKSYFSNKIYKPKSGEFLIFPGFLYHQTVPFTGNLRLSMPVDLFL
jgi:hypothetical protein